jgi:uncharacterized repeat protein (TIGR01451 family)
MKKLHVFVTVSALASGSAIAGINQWTQVGPGGGSISTIKHLPGQTDVALATGRAGIYRTENNGESWTHLQDYGHTAGFATAIAPNADGSIVLIAVGDLFRSTDGGRTFVNIGQLREADPSIVSVAFSRDGTVAWAGTNSGHIYRSTDGGETWRERTGSFLGGVKDIEVDAASSSVAYALNTSGSLYRTIDDGLTWSFISTPGIYRGITASPLTPNFLLGITGDYPFRSVDRGNSWMQATFPSQYVAEYAPSPEGRIVAVGQSQIIFTSTDHGLFWPGRGRLPVAPTKSISIDPVDFNRLLIGTDLGVMRSADAGLTWSQANIGITEPTFRGMAIASDGSDRIYATGYDAMGPYLRDAQTGQWRAVGVHDSTVFSTAGPDVYALAADPKDSTRLIMSRNGRSGVSTNSGANWTQGGSVQARFIAIDPVNGQIAYAATATSGVRKTIDGGLTWNSSSNGLPAAIAHIAIDPTNPNVLYACSDTGRTAGFYKSVDAGANWAETSAGLETVFIYRIAIDPKNTQTLYAGTSEGVRKSINGGAAWTQALQTFDDSLDVVIDPILSSNLYALNDRAEVRRSVDSGETWEVVGPFNAQKFYVTGVALALLPSRPTVLTMSTVTGGLQEIEIAPDLALTTRATGLVAGAQQSVVLTVNNAGPLTASRVRLIAALPSGSLGVSAQTASGSCAVAGQQLKCELGALKIFSPVDVTVTLTAGVGADPLMANIQGYEQDPLTQNNSITLVSEQRSNLGTRLTGESSLVSGNRADYLAVVTNDGPSPASGVRVSVQLSSNLQWVSATSSAGNCPLNGDTATCDIGPLAAGASSEIRIAANALSTGQFTVHSSVTSSGTDPVSGNDATDLNGNIVAPAGGGGGGTGGGGNSSGGGGGSFTWFWLAMLSALQAFTVYRRRS